MSSSNIRDLLTSFSPSLDLFAISSGDGRIKIWDTIKGQIQTEFADIVSTDEGNVYAKAERGHLSVDYTCMKWLSLDRTKKRKFGSSLLVLGTGSGDVLALDVAAGQLKWRVSDCHPGGVTAISFSKHNSCVYTAGADGMVCKIEFLTGNLSGKFKASTKAMSCMTISTDGKILATAAGQMKIFRCSDHKKMQKFAGHPEAVRCMSFSQDGKYIISSSLGERYIAVWKIDGGKKQSACCVLAMEHPAVLLDCWSAESTGVEDTGLYILAVSEVGTCYFWYGRTIEELRNAKPTKVSSSSGDTLSKIHRGPLPAIFAAKLQGIANIASGNVFIAHGLPVKPLFQKILVHFGTDIELSSSHDGVLLPINQLKSKKRLGAQSGVTALDRSNAEDALLPLPKSFHHQDMDSRSGAMRMETDDQVDEMEAETETICLENRLKELGLLSSKDDITPSIIQSEIFKDIDLKASLPEKKIKTTVLSMSPHDANELLGVLVAGWHSRTYSGKFVLPWIYSILVNHSSYITSLEPNSQMIDSLFRVTRAREVAVQPLLQLSGRLQLIMTQVDAATQNKTQTLECGLQEDEDEEEDEDEDEDVDEVLYGEEEDDDDESEISSDED